MLNESSFRRVQTRHLPNSVRRLATDYLGIAWKWLQGSLGTLITDEWYPTVSDAFEGLVIVSGGLVDKTGESRSFAVLMTKDGTVDDHRSYVTPKQLTVR